MNKKKGRVFRPIICNNPNCKVRFTPKNPKHRVCNKKQCKEWLKQDNKYKPVRYRFSNRFIETNFPNGVDSVNIELLRFTKNDIEKER